MRTLSITSALLSAALLCAPLHAAHVTDPKASYIDIKVRRNELKHTKDARIQAAIASLPFCTKLPEVAPPQGRMVIPPHYLNGSHGATNPAEKEATQVYYAFEKRVTAGMNQWLVTGDANEARCAQQQIDSWAKAGTLLDYDAKANRQSWFQVEWTASSIAISESVIVNEKSLDKDMLTRDLAWLNKVAHRSVEADKTSKQTNNHHYWRGLMATATGIVTSDDDLFTWGVNVFKEAVDEIDQRGAFPQEMKRNELAIHYQAFALQPLIPLASLAERQNVFLYSYKSNNGRDIGDAVVFLGDSMANPSLIKAYTPEEQVGYNGADTLSFAEFFAHRFGIESLGRELPLRLEKPTYASRIGGSTTVMAGVPLEPEKKKK